MGLQYFRNQQAQADSEREMSFNREKWAAELQARREAALQKAAEPEMITNSQGDHIRLYPDGRQEVVYADPYGKPQFQRVEAGDGSVTLQPVAGGNRPSDAHVAALRANPDRAADFDAKFGRGMAAYYLGSR